MNLIGCLDRPTKGKVYIKGKDISKLSDNKLALIRRDQIGFVFQQFNLISRLSALENVVLPMWFAGVDKNKRIKRATNLLKKVGLEKRITHKPTELSGGERQRVSIARAIANNPELILADEPTGNLDSKSGNEIMDLLKTLNNDGKTIIIVTHELEFARRAKKMVKLKDGLIEK
jgi:putative ABC transport system ATP-binding protein